jgi:hypothetical protein
MLVHCQIMELGKMSGRASRTSPATGVADPAARLEDLARRRAVAGNAWCPRLTAAMILSGSAVHVKGFGSALVSARKRLMAAWGSTTERKRPRFRRRLDSLAKKPSTALSQEHEVRVKWKTKRSCRSSQARTLDACGRRSCRG